MIQKVALMRLKKTSASATSMLVLLVMFVHTGKLKSEADHYCVFPTELFQVKQDSTQTNVC